MAITRSVLFETELTVREVQTLLKVARFYKKRSQEAYLLMRTRVAAMRREFKAATPQERRSMDCLAKRKATIAGSAREKAFWKHLFDGAMGKNPVGRPRKTKA